MLKEPLLRWAELSRVQGDTASQPTPSDLLLSQASRSLRECLSRLATQLNDAGRLALDLITLDKAVDRLSGFGIGWKEIDEYCSVEFPNMFFARYHVIAALVLLSGRHIGIHIGPNVVRERMPTLTFDEDGLLTETEERMRLRKEGVQIQGYLLQYSDCLLSYNLGLQGGFLERLSALSGHPNKRIHVAINPHILLDSSYWSSIQQRIYIRGPKAPSPQQLGDPWFPEIARGEVTEHRRLEKDPALELMLPLDAIQVMWSRRTGRKSVQIEELVPIDSARHARTDYVLNRYMHSIWKMKEAEFVHIDGAIRAYSKDLYPLRQSDDLRKYSGKADRYKKLFRIDGPVHVEGWSDLTWKFFFGNELVIEYLASL